MYASIKRKEIEAKGAMEVNPIYEESGRLSQSEQTKETA